MTVTQLAGALTSGVTGTERERIAIKKVSKPFASKTSIQFRNEDYLTASYRRKLSSNNFARRCGLIDAQQTADYALIPSDVEDSDLTGSYATTSPLRVQSVQTELIMLSLPAIAGQAIEPLAQLMETAYIGRIGPLELASAGVSISIFNIMSKVFNIPLLSIATSFVAEDISRNENKESTSDGGSQNGSTNGSPLNKMGERKMLPSVSTALLLAIGIGILEALAMYFGSGPFLSMMGISSASSMRGPAQQFLKLRAVGAPAVVLYLAIQGILRGFKDTKTPVLCLGIGNLSAVFLFPLLMYHFRLGVTGAAISTIASQYIVAFLMIWYLNKRTVLFQPHMKGLHFGGYLRSAGFFYSSSVVLTLDGSYSGGFLLGRTLAAVMTITLSTSMAARLGPLAMAAHQICLQVWLSVALLADAQAASGQALIARSFTKRDYSTVKKIAYFALQGGLFTGISIAAILGVSFGSLATLFTRDAEVLDIVRSLILFVSASQPLTALAYIFDGLHYGVSDFSYAAWSTMVVGAISSAFLLYAPSIIGLPGVWWGLTLFMVLRTIAGFIRLSSKVGPWWFLQEDIQKAEFAI